MGSALRLVGGISRNDADYFRPIVEVSPTNLSYWRGQLLVEWNRQGPFRPQPTPHTTCRRISSAGSSAAPGTRDRIGTPYSPSGVAQRTSLHSYTTTPTCFHGEAKMAYGPSRVFCTGIPVCYQLGHGISKGSYWLHRRYCYRNNFPRLPLVES